MPALATDPPRRWGGAIAGPILLLLVASRALPGPGAARQRQIGELLQRARVAFADGRYPDAAEYARHGLGRKPLQAPEDELRVIRGRSLLRLGRPVEAVAVLEPAAENAAGSSSALAALAEAYETLGRSEDAAAVRSRLGKASRSGSSPPRP